MAKVKKDNIAQRHIQEAFSSEIVELKKLNQETAKAIPELQQTIEDFKDFREKPFKIDTSDLKNEVSKMVAQMDEVANRNTQKLEGALSIPLWVYILTLALAFLLSGTSFLAYDQHQKKSEVQEKADFNKDAAMRYRDFIQSRPNGVKEYKEWEKTLNK